jgi:hypothetical protein
VAAARAVNAAGWVSDNAACSQRGYPYQTSEKLKTNCCIHCVINGWEFVRTLETLRRIKESNKSKRLIDAVELLRVVGCKEQ